MGLRIAFLCSGDGGNLKFIAELIRIGVLDEEEICCVLTDRKCGAGMFAEQHDIYSEIYDFSDQFALKDKLVDLNPGCIITNVHKILSSEIVGQFRGKLINLHYSILPAFGGVIGIKALSLALNYGVQVVGVTAHLVDDALDSGKPLVQAVTPVNEIDDLQSLMDVVFRMGCISLLAAIKSIRGDTSIGGSPFKKSVVNISGRPTVFSPPVYELSEFYCESFWSRLK